MPLLLRNGSLHAWSAHDRQSSACEHTDTFTCRWKHAMPTYWPHMFVCIYVKYVLLGKVAAALLINCIVKEGLSYTAFRKEKQIKEGKIKKARVTMRLHHEFVRRWQSCWQTKVHAEQDYITAAGVLLLSLIVIKIGLHVQRTNTLRPLQQI